MVPGANETRWKEQDMGHCDYAWVCEKCELTWQFDWEGPQEHGVNYCPGCGRRIVEFVKYQDPLDEVEEGFECELIGTSPSGEPWVKIHPAEDK